MVSNKELFTRDPLTSPIPNDGVAKVSTPQSDQEWQVLRYELDTFVCEGEYQRGLDRILGTYLKYVGEPQQPAVWVSGFYGSGKSHLVRVLEYLWNDVKFVEDGATARGLAKLPADIKAHLQELTITGRKNGGLWSAAGTIGGGAGDSVRLAILGIVFRSAGLPEQYGKARFVIWLKQNDYYEALKSGVEAAGKTFDGEMQHFFMSPVLVKALRAVNPDLADSDASLRNLLRESYPQVADISDDEMVSVLGDVLALQSTTPGKLPCTLIVLDEVQQFIGDDADRTHRVDLAAQACSKKFGSLILFVATGQSALQATPQLQKLQDRFTVRVQLSDKDVETVVRSVVLRKAPDKEELLKETLDSVSGEIDRHLPGTKIAPEAADKAVLTADYPLLPTRRRFWERALRAVDKAGASGQLRTQLRVVHEAARAVASEPVGHVVAGDFLYGQVSASLLQTGVLLREVDEIIQKEDDGTTDGKLRSRLASLIFLIGQLPTDVGADSGVRATVNTLADLLVTDLKAGSAAIRQRIPDLLQQMADAGRLMEIGGEYRLQTRESAEWESVYRSKLAKITNDDIRIAADRGTVLKLAVGKALDKMGFAQGDSGTPRKVELHFGGEEPKTDTGNVPVWIRDEWATSEKTVVQEAQQAGPDGPVVYVLLPKRNGEDLKKALAGFAAAKETLETKPTPTTADGIVARDAMRSRQEVHERQVASFVAAILKDAKVFQGGGNEVAQADLKASVAEAGQASVARLYPQFSVADFAASKWAKVGERAQQGNGAALSTIGYTGEVDKHPVCKAVLDYVGTVGKKGSEIRKNFLAPSYGWPQDAVDAALLVLLHGNHVSASANGTPVALATLDKPKIAQAEFRREGVTVSTLQRIAVKNLLQGMNIPLKSGEEGVGLRRYVDGLIDLAKAAGGEKPLPPQPDISHLTPLQSQSGNQLLLSIHDLRDRLAKEGKDWADAAQRIRERQPRWRTLENLLKSASDLPVYSTVKPQVDAIRDSRLLLSDPDPVPPLCSQVTSALRTAVTAAREDHLEKYGEQLENLLVSEAWGKLSEADQKAIRASNQLGPVPEVNLGTEEQLIATLDALPLPIWEQRTAALSERVKRALLEATKRLEPQAVSYKVPSRTLKTEDDIEAYLEELRTALLAYVSAGNPVVI